MSMQVEHISDEALMQEFQGGNARAFERLLNRHKKPVFNFLRRQVGSDGVAEDLLQEVFLRVVRSAPRYQQTARFTTWMYTIARNLCVDYVRRQKHRDALPLDGQRQEPVDQAIAADAAAMSRQLAEGIERAISSLSDEQREVFLLREYHHLTFKEVAKIVGCNESTAKSRMRYALEHLRKALKPYRELARAAR